MKLLPIRVPVVPPRYAQYGGITVCKAKLAVLCAVGLFIGIMILLPFMLPVSYAFDYNPQLIPSNGITFEGITYDPHTAKYILIDRFFIEAAKYNISAFVLDGVLLGYMRYGSILPWDHDIEIRFHTSCRPHCCLRWIHDIEIPDCVCLAES